MFQVGPPGCAVPVSVRLASFRRLVSDERPNDARPKRGAEADVRTLIWSWTRCRKRPRNAPPSQHAAPKQTTETRGERKRESETERRNASRTETGNRNRTPKHHFGRSRLSQAFPGSLGRFPALSGVCRLSRVSAFRFGFLFPFGSRFGGLFRRRVADERPTDALLKQGAETDILS